jgi:hypothetical protein
MSYRKITALSFWVGVADLRDEGIAVKDALLNKVPAKTVVQ